MSVYKKVFYDTNPLIYYLEQNDDYLGKMKRFITEQTEADSDFVTSTITVGEYLTGPYKKIVRIPPPAAFPADVEYPR